MPLPGGVVGSITTGKDVPSVSAPTNDTLRMNEQPLDATVTLPVKLHIFVAPDAPMQNAP